MVGPSCRLTQVVMWGWVEFFPAKVGAHTEIAHKHLHACPVINSLSLQKSHTILGAKDVAVGPLYS